MELETACILVCISNTFNIHYRSSSCGVIQIQFTLFYVGILLLRSLDIDDGAMQLMGFGQDSFFSEIGTSISFVCIYIYLYMYIHRVICKYITICDFLVGQLDYRGRMRNQFDSGFNTYIFIYKLLECTFRLVAKVAIQKLAL